MAAASSKSQARQFQAPRGTRDFYPQDMAVRRYIESVWRSVSINHGFDEIDGPTFESLELYTHKSGSAIASELFQVVSGKDEKEIAQLQQTGKAPLALRPEFTPTLARMVAARAAELPRPIKWFAIPPHFRAERPQRGRLREFLQWNVDFIGDESPRADAEVITAAVCALERLGLTGKDITVRVSDRTMVSELLEQAGVNESNREAAMSLLDRRDRMEPDAFTGRCIELHLNLDQFAAAAKRSSEAVNQRIAAAERGQLAGEANGPDGSALIDLLARSGVLKWCEFDLSIVRGLAYYTGTVFEIHEASGAARAIAGGGRYDNLIESFGGPKLPACGFGMGDVVLANLLHDKGLLPEEVYMAPLRPHAFVIAADDAAAAQLPRIVASLRQQGFHVRHSYKTTRNVGKLLGEASKANGGAMCAIILGDKLAANLVDVKDLQSGQQGNPIAVQDLPGKLRELQALYQRS